MCQEVVARRWASATIDPNEGLRDAPAAPVAVIKKKKKIRSQHDFTVIRPVNRASRLLDLAKRLDRQVSPERNDGLRGATPKHRDGCCLLAT